MHASSSFKQSFLKNMLLGLKLGGVSSKSMSLAERKRAIKLSADIAMAFSRDGAHWSHALIQNLSREEESKALVRSILGKEHTSLTKPYYTRPIQRSKKILRRSFHVNRSRKRSSASNNGIAARILARRMVKKKTRVLKSLIPGGDSLDDFSLLGETIDYVVSLQAQVDIMQLLARSLNA